MREKKHTANPTDRRRFIGNTIKLVVLGSLLPASACNDNKNPSEAIPGSPSEASPGSPRETIPGSATQKNKSNRGRKKIRKKWHYESLVMNSKSKVVHFPTSKMYHYYDEIKPNHLKEISLAAWTLQLRRPVRLNKQQSGNITEMLTLRELGKGVNDRTLAAATNTLSIAFGKEYEKVNVKNFRLHELMLQLITLNSAVPANQKWQAFSVKVVKPARLRKRQKWMESENNFNQRVKYISDRSGEYKARLSKRASKYSFS